MTPLTLSRVVLEVRARRGASHEYITHQLVADLFGDRADRGYLYRTMRESRDRSEVHALILSPDPPANRVPQRPWGRVIGVERKPFAPRLSPGDPLDFELRLNATCVVTDAHGNKRRTDVWDAATGADRDDPRSPHEVYGDYLQRKLDSAARILAARVDARGQVRVRRAGSSRPITYIAANVIGTLHVVEPERLVSIVAAGIGRSKAFGCGLLCLSRPGTVLPRAHRMRQDSA